MIRAFQRSRVPASRSVTTVIIGAGHSGLAMSRCLTEVGVDHVVLERGEVANSWRRERWDSLRLLTPNWQARLPGHAYHGADPDGFMTMPEVVDFIDGYGRRIAAPVQTGTTVTSVRRDSDGYRVVTARGEWRCRAVVMASGGCNLPVVPAAAEGVPACVATFTPMQYRRPGDLPAGGVLVAGASATGVQLAEEIHRAGRPVVLSVGEHVRMPRRYRDRDVQWWMHHAGLLDQRFTEVDDLTRARGVASPQLIGSPDHRTLDLNALTDSGIELVGRLAGISDGVAQFSGALRNHCAMADLKLGRLLDTFDQWATQAGLDSELPAAERFAPTRLPERQRLTLDLGRGEIRSIVWATGYRPDYGWLEVPVLDRKGRLRHDGGVVDSPGLYVMGLPFLRRRKSTFIHGAEDDARELSAHLKAYLDRPRSAVTTAAAG